MLSHVSITKCFNVKQDNFLSETSNYSFYLNFLTNEFYFSVYSWTNTNTHVCVFIMDRNGFKTSSHNLVQFVENFSHNAMLSLIFHFLVTSDFDTASCRLKK